MIRKIIQISLTVFLCLVTRSSKFYSQLANGHEKFIGNVFSFSGILEYSYIKLVLKLTDQTSEQIFIQQKKMVFYKIGM
jgi:hypothetical protein